VTEGSSSTPLELRSGARARYLPAHSGVWRVGTLVRPSANDEEWLVKNEHGRFWVHVSRLRPADGPLPDH